MCLFTAFLDVQTLFYQTSATVNGEDEFGNPKYIPNVAVLDFVLTEMDNATSTKLSLEQRIGGDVDASYYLCACVTPNTLPSEIKEGYETSFTLNGRSGTLRFQRKLETTFGLATNLFGEQFLVTFET